jgi:hypothetical protein
MLYKSCSLGVEYWLARVRAGGRGGVQLGIDVMQRLLLSPANSSLPALTKDPASMLHLGLTDEANPAHTWSPSSVHHAPDHSCFSRAFAFNACPISGSIRSAITQSVALPYYYILCAQMQVHFLHSHRRIHCKTFCAELHQTERFTRALVDLQQRASAQRAVRILADAELIDPHHVAKQNMQNTWTSRQRQDNAAAMLCKTCRLVSPAGQ